MEIFVPVLMGLTLIWLVGRGVPLNNKLMVVVATLGLIVAIVWLERSGFWPDAWTLR